MHHNRNICETLQLINKFCRLTFFFYLGVPFFYTRRCMNFSLALHNRNEVVCMDLMPAAYRVLLFFSFFCVIHINTRTHTSGQRTCIRFKSGISSICVQNSRQTHLMYASSTTFSSLLHEFTIDGIPSKCKCNI